jgi:putative ATPase
MAGMDLFEASRAERPPDETVPLAERMRPRTVDDFVGQAHLMGEGKPLRVLLQSGAVPSMILWGPPGTGKTTLARLMAHHVRAEFHQLSAVASGVKDVREIIDRAARDRAHHASATVLFIDEIHRFTRSQQDALLHSVEDGVLTLIGATTENPSFEVISPLLSRCRVYILSPLTASDLEVILERALRDDVYLARRPIVVDDRDGLFALSGGDARMLLNGLETAVRLARPGEDGAIRLGKSEIEASFQKRLARYDRVGDEHYTIISAYIKSIRGSDPDAAVYWLARMLEGGEDPKFIARRLIIVASEDIGNADPYAITLATTTFTAVDCVGMPEGRIVLAQATTYLASCPKSNASYVALSEASEDARVQPDAPVPLHLRNASTGLLKELGYGRDYQYAHDHPGSFVEQQYFPDAVGPKVYYRPTANGAEQKIRERLLGWWRSRRR